MTQTRSISLVRTSTGAFSIPRIGALSIVGAVFGLGAISFLRSPSGADKEKYEEVAQEARAYSADIMEKAKTATVERHVAIFGEEQRDALKERVETVFASDKRMVGDAIKLLLSENEGERETANKNKQQLFGKIEDIKAGRA